MSNIFVGFIFILFDFSLNIGSSSISLIPSFIGFWFMGKGLTELQDKSETLSKMISWSKGLMIYYAIAWVLNIFAVTFGILSIILGLVIAVLNIWFTYKVVVGIKEVEDYVQTDIHADELKSAWIATLIAMIVTFLIAWIPLLGIIGIIVAFALNVYFMVVMNRVKSAYISIPPMQSETTFSNDEI